MPRLVEQLRAIGISISKRHVMRLLIGGQDEFLEAREVLRAGLQTASWLTVDDTGARHKANNGFARRSATTISPGSVHPEQKPIEFPRAAAHGYTDYVLNDAALSYMRERSLAGRVIACLAEHPDRQFADPAAWQAHLRGLGSPSWQRRPTRCRSPPKVRCGAASRRTVSCVRA